MPNATRPDISLFLDILLKLETLDIPYVIIGGFAATMYGITRATYDIDIIVDMGEKHIEALADAYPLPRFYADPHQMRRAIAIGSSFNIIDVERGEKANLSRCRWTGATRRPLKTGCARRSIWSALSLSPCGSHGPKT